MQSREIAARLDALSSTETAALVTVLRTRGSTYRRAGARLLVTRDGRVGMVSGGCLEGDIERVCHRVMEQGRAELATFDTTADEEALLGWGLGCQGVLELLVQPVARDDAAAQALIRAADGEPSVMAVALSGPSARVGDTLVLREGRPVLGTLGAPAADAAATLAGHWREPGVRELDTAEGPWEVFAEALAPPPGLLLCGAGDDAVPLATIADTLGWRVTVVDHRPGAVTPARFPPGVDVRLAADAAVSTLADSHTATVVMSHNLPRDMEYLATLLETPAPYIGVLGPRARLDRMVDELTAADPRVAALWRDGSARVHGPAGFDIGAESPEEVSLAILAEALATLRGYPGGSLRDQRGPIHGPR